MGVMTAIRSQTVGMKPRTLVVGMGKTGLSVVRHLASEGVPLAVTDSRTKPPSLAQIREEFPDIAVFVGGFDAGAFDAAEQIVLSPGVAISEPLIAAACRRGVSVIGDVELFARRALKPIVAISGANGKSTVTTLAAEMINACGVTVLMGGNIGTPALELLDGPAPDFYVLELSSFQLETTYSLRAAAACVLNVTADHMDRYADFNAYRAAKLRIYAGAGTCVYNRDDSNTVPGQGDSRALSFGLSEPRDGEFGVIADAHGEWLAYGREHLIATASIPLAGRHNQANVLAALALVHAVGLPIQEAVGALASFRGLPHRMVLVAEHQGVRWYNDSKGTNVGATTAALSGLTEPVVLIAGGLSKDADFTPLRDVLRRHVRAVVLIGRDAPLIEQAIGDVVPAQFAANMADAVRRAAALARRGDSVVLSPACASFDMFKGFEHRGEVFTQAVLDHVNDNV